MFLQFPALRALHPCRRRGMAAVGPIRLDPDASSMLP
jgi:hypothetical protein